MSTSPSASSSSAVSPPAELRRTIGVVLLAWAALAVGVSVSGVLASAPPFITPLIIWSSVIAFLVLRARVPTLRAYLQTVDLRPLVLLHLTRVVAGTGFLVLHQRGQLVGDLALRAGWGDIAVGLTAPLAVLALSVDTPAGRRGALLWNVLGVLDMLMVLTGVQRLLFFSGTPEVLAPMTRFPFSLLPLFVVPLVLITHFTVMVRLWRPLSGRSGPWARR